MNQPNPLAADLSFHLNFDTVVQANRVLGEAIKSWTNPYLTERAMGTGAQRHALNTHCRNIRRLHAEQAEAVAVVAQILAAAGSDHTQEEPNV